MQVVAEFWQHISVKNFTAAVACLELTSDPPTVRICFVVLADRHTDDDRYAMADTTYVTENLVFKALAMRMATATADHEGCLCGPRDPLH